MRSTRRPVLTRDHLCAARATRGFSLIELMMVVAITGVLAAVAIPAFNGYVQKSRTSEATNFLGVIKLREEAYRSEFGQYAGSSQTLAGIAFTPGNISVMNNAVTRRWPDAPGEPFAVLGARPDGDVRFGYGVAAGPPSVAVANLPDHGVTADRADFYFVAQAVTDLNGDGDGVLFEITSFTRSIWVSNRERGWD